jgi:hypothetical protein
MAVKYARALAAQVKRDRRTLEHTEPGRAFLARLDPYLLALAARVDAAARVSDLAQATHAGHGLARRTLGALRSRQPRGVVRRYMEQVALMEGDVAKARTRAEIALAALPTGEHYVPAWVG